MEESIKHENIKQMLEELPQVRNMQSSRGNDIVNQFIVSGKGFTLFQSYNSSIAMHKGNKTYIFKDWDYSTTTGKYRNLFLGETKKETLAKLKSGEYIAVDFNLEELGITGLKEGSL